MAKELSRFFTCRSYSSFSRVEGIPVFRHVEAIPVFPIVSMVSKLFQFFQNSKFGCRRYSSFSSVEGIPVFQFVEAIPRPPRGSWSTIQKQFLDYKFLTSVLILLFIMHSGPYWPFRQHPTFQSSRLLHLISYVYLQIFYLAKPYLKLL